MRLHDYLDLPGAPTQEELCAAAGIKNVDQLRQWRHGYAGRVPSPANCVAIEAATNRAVMRWDLRPDDWHLIWPELKKVKGSPQIDLQAPAVTAAAEG